MCLSEAIFWVPEFVSGPGLLQGPNFPFSENVVKGWVWERLPRHASTIWPGQRQTTTWPRQRKTEIPGSNRLTHCLAILWNVEGTLGMAQWQHLGSCKSIRTERERNESDREEGWGIRLTILSGRRWSGDNGLCFASTTMCLTWCSEAVLLGVDALVAWSVSLLSSHGSLHVEGALMVFKCLTLAHTILVGLAHSWKEEKGETLTHLGSSYWGALSSGAFGTHQRVTLARVPQLLPQYLPVCRGSLWKRRSEEVGKETPRSMYGPPKMSRCGLEKNFQTWDRMRGK